MSSPIAKARKSSVDRALIALHQSLSHGHRIETLARELAVRIRQIPQHIPCEALRVLDVGCGDMRLADALAPQLERAEFRCVDVHPCPSELAACEPRWQRYAQFGGGTLPFDAGSFDVVLFCDVLHHVPAKLRRDLLASAGRVGHTVLIKEHFEYGWWSRQTLRAMDFVGNFGYGVSVPERYFDRAALEQLCTNAGLQIECIDVGLRLYDHLPMLRKVLSPRWQSLVTCHRAA